MDWQKLPLATITIAILFMCGGLYLVGFWSTFNLNVASFISFTDIPKSFILPLISTFGFFFIYTLSNLIYDFYDSEESTLTRINNNPTKWQRFLRKIKKPEFVLYFCMSVALYFYGSYNRSVTYWFFSSEVVALSSWGWFIRDTYIRSKFANKYVRRSVGAVLVIFPILSYSSGKIDSVKILNNDEVRVFAFQEDSTKKNKDTLKIISLLNDKIIASSLNNKKIYILNQSVAAKIELFDLSPVLGKKTIKHIEPRSIVIKH